VGKEVNPSQTDEQQTGLVGDSGLNYEGSTAVLAPE
jgi:hypothetical protein